MYLRHRVAPLRHYLSRENPGQPQPYHGRRRATGFSTPGPQGDRPGAQWVLHYTSSLLTADGGTESACTRASVYRSDSPTDGKDGSFRRQTADQLSVRWTHPPC